MVIDWSVDMIELWAQVVRRLCMLFVILILQVIATKIFYYS